MNYLPLAPPGMTPPRVLSIAGSDSGGGAGIQADMRTMALLGVHACVAVTAVTVQNTLGVKDIHEVPNDVVAGQIEAVVTDIGVQAAKTGMLASSRIVATVAATWRRLELSVPLVVDPVCASMHGDPLLAPSALDSLRGQLFPLATLLTPNLDEARLLVDIEVVDAESQRAAAKALHALGPQWVLVKGGHLRSSDGSCDLLYDGVSCYQFDAQRLPTGDPQPPETDALSRDASPGAPPGPRRRRRATARRKAPVKAPSATRQTTKPKGPPAHRSSSTYPRR